MGKVDVINEKDEVIGEIDESEVHQNKDIITRAVAVQIFNSEGKLLLQKRSQNKYRYPLHWTFSASGFVDQNETYLLAAVRELKEELNITSKPEDLEFLFKKFIAQDIKHISVLYKLTLPNEINNFSNQEVDSVNYFSMVEIKEMIKKGEMFSPFFIQLFKEMIKNK